MFEILSYYDDDSRGMVRKFRNLRQLRLAEYDDFAQTNNHCLAFAALLGGGIPLSAAATAF
jgi:hypothetical protein